jgi:hypothetical protein
MATWLSRLQAEDSHQRAAAAITLKIGKMQQLRRMAPAAAMVTWLSALWRASALLRWHCTSAA